MLKPAERGPPSSERPISELLHEVVEDGKAYVRAELGLAKAIVASKSKAIAVPAVLFAIAFLCGLAAIVALAVGIVMALETFIGPLAAGFVGMLIFASVAGVLGWAGYGRLRHDL